MKTLYHVLSVALLGLALASCSKTSNENTASTESAAPSAAPVETGPVARGEAAAIHVAFSVEAVDAEKRLITLKGPQGNVGEYEVGDQVQRLAEIKPGDKIHAEYKVAAVAELREPTAEEKSAPLVAVTAGERGTAEAPPAAGIGRAVRVVTTIDALDRANQSITVKGPEGNTVTARVEDPAVFERLSVGQTIVVKFAETLVLSVQPKAKA
ncbi:MAG TPA: hypothetical protein VFQ05_05685 [Candidatus Eisenbacteria bacterium]|nr:hypothetical protein [Candidatus Eisenbacteria bacterium]